MAEGLSPLARFWGRTVRFKYDSLVLSRRGGASRRVRVGGLWLVLVLTSLGLMVLSRLDHSYVRWGRAMIAEAMAPVLGVVRVPLEPMRKAVQHGAEYLEFADRFEQLKRENAELESSKWRVQELERQLADLSTLAHVVKEPQVPFISARVIASAPGMLASSVIISAGRGNRVLSGHAVIGAGGLVGRVVDARETTARVLLVTDPVSRIPVAIGAGHVRAVMMGDNGPLPRLGLLPAGASIKTGEVVVTSGAGGLLPRGLRVGEVGEIDGRHVVRLAARPGALDYVSVLLHDTPELELSDGPGARAVGRRAQFKDMPARESTP